MASTGHYTTISPLFVKDNDESADDDDISLTSTVAENDEKEYVVDAILAERAHEIPERAANGDLQYLIKWEGFPLDQSTWEPFEHLNDELYRDWEAAKKEVAAGERIAFDMGLYREACMEAAVIKQSRHNRRNAKRIRLGMLPTKPFPAGYLGASSASVFKKDESLSDEAMESDEIDSGLSAKPPPPRKPIKQTMLKGIPSANFAPNSSSDSANLQTSFSSLPERSSSKETSTVPYEGTAKKPSTRPVLAVRPTVKSNSLSSKFGGNKRLTATRTRLDPKAISKDIASSLHASKVRKPRKNLIHTMMDTNKAPKPFSNMRRMNLAKKRGQELNDAAPANPSAIPASFLLTSDVPPKNPSIDPQQDQPDKDADQYSTYVRPAGTLSTGPKKARKSVRFTEYSVDNLFGEPMEIDSPLASEAERSAEKPQAAPRKLSLANYQERSTAQTVSKLASFGPEGSQEISVLFNAVPRVNQPWLSQFLADEALQFRTVCTSENFISQGFHNPDLKLSSGKLESTRDIEHVALEAVAENLRRAFLGLHLTRVDYSILVYPANTGAWISLADSASSEGVLRYLIFTSSFSSKLYPPLSVASTDQMHGDQSPAALVRLAFKLFSNMDYPSLLPPVKPSRGQDIFFLVFHPSQDHLSRILTLWLRACQPSCRVFSNQLEGNWNRFQDATNNGAVIFHESATRNVRKIPRLWHALKHGAHNFWNLSSAGFESMRNLTTTKEVPESPVHLELTRLFPHGRAFLITPSFALSEPAQLCKFFDWFKSRAEFAHCALVACSNFPDYLRDLALEKARDVELFNKRHRGNPQLEHLAASEGLGEVDLSDRFRAWQLLKDIIDFTHKGFGIDEPSEDIRKTVWVDNFIDPNDEQSLVNWFAWWSTTRVDCYRKFYVLGSAAKGVEKAHRMIHIPNYTPETVSNSDSALSRISQYEKEISPSPAPSPTTALPGDGVFQSSMFKTGQAHEFRGWLKAFNGSRGASWSRLFSQPVSWVDVPMADHFKDLRLEFTTFKNWLSWPPKFNRHINTLVGFFYTVDTDWKHGDTECPITRHPWIAIYRPINPDKDPERYSAMELLIWDYDMQNRMLGSPGKENLLPMQRRLVDFVREEAPKRYPEYHLEKVWAGGFIKPEGIDSTFPVDMTFQAIQSFLLNSKFWLAPWANLLIQRGWRQVIEPTGYQVSNTIQTPTSVGEVSEFPKCPADVQEPQRIIFHPPQRVIYLAPNQVGRTTCTNYLFEAALKARQRDPDCMTFDFQYKTTLDWYHDLKFEQRDYKHMCIDSWDKVFKDINLDKP